MTTKGQNNGNKIEFAFKFESITIGSNFKIVTLVKIFDHKWHKLRCCCISLAIRRYGIIFNKQWSYVKFIFINSV